MRFDNSLYWKQKSAKYRCGISWGTLSLRARRLPGESCSWPRLWINAESTVRPVKELSRAENCPLCINSEEVMSRACTEVDLVLVQLFLKLHKPIKCEVNHMLCWYGTSLTILQLSSIFWETRCCSWFILNFMANLGKGLWLRYLSLWQKYFPRYLQELLLVLNLKHPSTSGTPKHYACLTWLRQGYVLPVQWLSLVYWQQSTAD